MNGPAVPRIIRITPFSQLSTLLRRLRTVQETVVVVEAFPARAQERSWLLALSRQAREQGTPLVFLSTSQAMRARLRKLHIPVAGTMQSAYQLLEDLATSHPTRSHPGRKRRPGPTDSQTGIRIRATVGEAHGSWLHRFMPIAVSSVLLLLTLATVLAFRQYVAPSATIVVHPPPERLAVEIPMFASLYVTAPDPDMGSVPANFVSVFHEVQRRGATSGQRLIPEERARGFVLARNVSGGPLEVPEGTYVQTSTGQAIAFVTSDAITLSADSQLQTLIPIVAVEAGEEGNVPANSINTIAGSLAFRLQITNPNPTTGGTSEWQSVVIQEDQEVLQNEMLQKVRQQAYNILVPEVAEGYWLPLETVKVDLQWASTDFFTDEATESLTVTIMVQVSGLAIRTADLLDYVMAQVEASTPPGAQLIASTLDFRFQPEVVASPTEVGFTVESSAAYVQQVDVAQIRSLVVGKTVQEARQLLQDLAPDIQVHPATQTALPSLPQRIQVRTQFLADSS